MKKLNEQDMDKVQGGEKVSAGKKYKIEDTSIYSKCANYGTDKCKTCNAGKELLHRDFHMEKNVTSCENGMVKVSHGHHWSSIEQIVLPNNYRRAKCQ